MDYKISAPQKVNCKIQLPASKSISNRVQIINALSGSEYSIENLSESDDAKVLYAALNSSGNVFDVGPAGTAMRFITAYLSKVIGEWTVTGSERMKNRPIKLLVDALKELGANIEYVEKEGYPPLKINGSHLVGKPISLPGNISSQYISALLMIGPTLKGGLDLTLTGKVISKPYIEMTLGLMKYFGVEAKWEDDKITIAEQSYSSEAFFVESDWSAASYWLQILALVGEGDVVLPDLFEDSLQGDSHITAWFELFGVSSVFNKRALHLSVKATDSKAIEIDFINQPDMAQTFAVTSCLLNKPFVFKGLQSLKIKETDRIYALITELKKLGFVLFEPEDGQLAWSGEKCELAEELRIETYDDHRMAMAFAPASIMFDGLIIEDVAVVSKSYPSFWDDLKKANFTLQEV